MDTAGTENALVRFASALASQDAGQRPADRLGTSACAALEADGAAITIDVIDTGRVLLTATTQSVERFECLQDVCGEGPTHDCSMTGRPVTWSPERDDGDRWPQLSTSAPGADLRGTFWTVPMRPARIVIGVLTLHRDVGHFRTDPPAAQVIADAVGAAILRDPGIIESDGDSGGPGSWRERARVHQATGMVVAQLRVSSSDALAMLKARAYVREVELLTVAGDVIERRIDFSARHGAEGPS